MKRFTLQLKNDTTVSFDAEIDFSVVELPYLCLMGFRQNGSSTASLEDLTKYWNLVEDFMDSQQLSHDQYETLVSIGDA